MTVAEFDPENAAALEAFEGVPLNDDAHDELTEHESFHKRMERIARICAVVFGVLYVTTSLMLIGGVTIGNVCPW